ncbi:MAG: PH domain-containing protein [Actinomycetota bacterium]|nr:PH domain-containing protein [Actinomycetota bacterium]
MNKQLTYGTKSWDKGYLLFMEPDEKTVFTAPGNLEKIIDGHLILTNKKLFFYFHSNIARDKKFIATYPYIISAKIKNGLFYSTLTIENKKESINIHKLRKKDSLEFHRLLNNIIKDNKKN